MSTTVTAKQTSDYYYIKCTLEQEEYGLIKSKALDPVNLKNLIVKALRQLHGSVGASIAVDILKSSQTNGEMILRVKASGLIKLWSSLTLLKSYNGKDCRFNVKQNGRALNCIFP